MLYKRDQWLPHTLDIKSESLIDKDYLRESLEQLIRESLEEALAGLLPYEQSLVELLNFSAENLARQDKLNIPDYVPLDSLPTVDFASMPYWWLLVDMLLIKSANWRQSVSKTIGFPASDKTNKEFDALCKSRKKQLTSLLEQLQNNDDLLETLNYLRKLPDPKVEESQWPFLSTIARVLVLLNAKLLLSFRKFKLVDHSQTSAAARNALMDNSAPTDLALALDNKIQHILVDEFQDTSKLQIDILEQLIAGWQADDGRTLFVVGDAMQSCYGFRNANVGLFLKVREGGLGDMELTPLTLQTNFRSQANIVNWVNRVFSSAFPQQANSSRGAVPYTESVTDIPALVDSGIETKLILFENGQGKEAMEHEAHAVVERITAIRMKDDAASIAILVRNRPHLAKLIPALRSANIQWQSTDIDRLESLPVIRDLTSLTRALLNLSDRVAWLAVLRAPWCGLNIADLHGVSSFAGDNSISFALGQLHSITALSDDGRARLQSVCQVLNFALSMRHRCHLQQLVETTWTLLRGACATGGDIELESAAHFFLMLGEFETAGGIDNITEFEAKVGSAFVPSKTEQENSQTIHIMTMHKAKGLEFDHVILPGLASRPKSNDKPLLQWHERLNEMGESRLFMATLSASGADDDALYKLLRYEQQRKTTLEDTRLLYIATTRAKQSVYLLATLKLSSKGVAKPESNSLLERIWREINNSTAGEIQQNSMPATQESLASDTTGEFGPYPAATPIKRFNKPLALSSLETQCIDEQQLPLTEPDEPSEPASQSDNAEHAAEIGTLIHNTLEAFANSPQSSINEDKLVNLRSFWRLRLRSLIEHEEQLGAALQFVEEAVINSVNDESVNWIFNSDLEDSKTELALTTLSSGYPADYIIDRSFIDGVGVRWIIDYKTASRADDQNLDSFIEEQCARHQAQLQNYQILFTQMEDRPVKIALFLTSIGKLVELNPPVTD
ncbi:MAG: UvrD-helicase domain-containing protein [Gammaproteobacteria bacterium]|nr:UvrD-helicase domain-containing protein [Gammaproteobacteria bacterium]